MKNYDLEYQRWLTSDVLTDEERAELVSIKDNEEEKALRFSALMDFGTAGLRSVMNMGVGSMNRFTVAHTTRGIAALIKASAAEERGVAIAYDSRNNSELFAKVSAEVLASEGIKVYIFDSLRPTPELSFAVIELGAIAGINITASHNPKEYNGYKAYWEDGAQISPEQAKTVSAARAKFDVLDTSGIIPYDECVKRGLITVLTEEYDEKYLKAVVDTAVCPTIIEDVRDSLKVVYTPLHGAGARLVPEVFRRRGLKYLYTVDEQMKPDGNFPTVKKPNPEYADVFTLGIAIADRVGSDLIIATDPDSDRVGVMARGKGGKFATISGNQMGALLLDYSIRIRKENGTMPKHAYCVKSLVSTDMAYKIAEQHGVRLHDVPTGFKFIGEVIKNYEAAGKDDLFLLGFEESYGYLMGTYARDKDAVEGAMMILEMTAYYKKLGMTLCDALEELYEQYGYYDEKTVDIYMEGLDGIERRRKVMAALRESIPHDFGGYPVRTFADYSTGVIRNIDGSECGVTGQPASDVLYYTLENDDKIIVRPSGTEPKIKIYVLAHGKERDALREKIKEYEVSAKRIAEV
ncbi:MAG: phospho-sugar mutase [Clostridia bacterium]|nr:phospho-sugar mutase [Clostridia bacterium]